MHILLKINGSWGRCFFVGFNPFKVEEDSREQRVEGLSFQILHFFYFLSYTQFSDLRLDFSLTKIGKIWDLVF